MMRRTRSAILAGAALLWGVPLPGQVVPLDDAVFQLLRGGEVVGEEHLTVHRVGLGRDLRIIAQSEIRMNDGSEQRPRLEAGTNLLPTTYQNRITGANAGEVVITRAGRRLVARIAGASGEAQREFRASDRTVILEEGVVLLYYFLGRWQDAPGTVLTVLDPTAGSPSRLTVEVLGETRIRLGQRNVTAQHMRLSGDEDVREVWFDDEGRVLRVAVPSSDFVAERRGS